MEWLQRRLFAVTSNNSRLSSAMNLAHSSLPRSISGNPFDFDDIEDLVSPRSHSSPTSPSIHWVSESLPGPSSYNNGGSMSSRLRRPREIAMGHNISHHQNPAYDGSPADPPLLAVLPPPGPSSQSSSTNQRRPGFFEIARRRAHSSRRNSDARQNEENRRVPPVSRMQAHQDAPARPRRAPRRIIEQDAAAAAEPRRSVQKRETSPAHPALHPYDSGSIKPAKLDIILAQPPLDEETLEKHAWNPDDRSLNVFVKEEDRLTLHRHPVAQSTDSIRGKVGYSRGFHVWKITWPQRMRGTHAVIGVGTKSAPLHRAGYSSLIGQTSEGYGWDLTRGKCYHDAMNAKAWSYPTTKIARDATYIPPDEIYCILDMDDGYMAFATDDEFLGVAARGLKGKKLYPMVSAVWGHCEVTMTYIGGLDPEPRQLMDICRHTILSQMGKKQLNRVYELPLPMSVRNFILYK